MRHLFLYIFRGEEEEESERESQWKICEADFHEWPIIQIASHPYLDAPHLPRLSDARLFSKIDFIFLFVCVLMLNWPPPHTHTKKKR